MIKLLAGALGVVPFTGSARAVDAGRDINGPSNGASGAGGWRRAVAGASTRSLAAKAEERLSIDDFDGADPTGVADSTRAIVAALAAGAARGWPVHVDGAYRYTAPIRVPGKVLLVGRGVSSEREASLRGVSCLVKDWNGPGVTFAESDSGAERVQFDSLPNRSGDNVVLAGQRNFLDWCAVTNAGRDNVRIGSDEPGGNANLWRLTFLITIGAGRHGLYISHPSDANGGMALGCDSRQNGGDGIVIDRSSWSTFINPVAQLNHGAGVRFTSNARSTNVVGGDVEGNAQGQGIIEAGAMGIVIDAPSVGAGLWVDLAPPGKNRLRYFAGDSAQMIDGDVLTVLNSRSGGVAAVEFLADTGEANVASIRARQESGTGGTLELYTKRDRNVPAVFMRADAMQRVQFGAAPAIASVTLPPDGSIAIDMSRFGAAKIDVQSPGTVHVAAPQNGIPGQRLTVLIANRRAAPIPDIGWASTFRVARGRAIAARCSTAVTFDCDGMSWIEIARSGDVPL